MGGPPTLCMLSRLKNIIPRASTSAAASMLSYNGPTTDIAKSAQLAPEPAIETATFANGCFWGTEHVFSKHFKNKLKDIKVGYIGGSEDSPSYKLVCTGQTGYAEACQMTFDPSVISFAELVEFHYRMHDPTQKNRQGPDTGPQYRSVVFYHGDAQRKTTEAVQSELQETRFGPMCKNIETQIEDAANYTWYDAEKYHQHYLDLNPGVYECPTHRLHW